jgi:hypothetical protein
MQGDVPQIGLLDIPRLPSPPKGPFLRGLLTPWVLIAAAAILGPRMLLVLILLVLRVLRVGSYWLYAKAPGPLGCLTVVVALPLFGVLSILMLPFHVLLTWNLMLSGFDDMDANRYVNWLIGPVIGTRD